MFQQRPDVHMRATFHILQIWWGDIDLECVPLKSTLVFNRHLKENGTSLVVIFDAKDEDGTIVKFTLPVHYFSSINHTDRKSVTDFPTGFVFNLTELGFQNFKDRLPGRVAEWEPKLKDKKRVLPKSILFVLDPSDFIMSEDNLVLYRPGFIEGIELFKLNYNEQWENHLCEQNQMDGKKFKNPIVPIEGKEFQGYFKKFGLRNAESEYLAGIRKKPIRWFLPRRQQTKQKPRRAATRRTTKTRANTQGNTGEDEEEHEDEEEDKDESFDSNQKQDESNNDEEQMETDVPSSTQRSSRREKIVDASES